MLDFLQMGRMKGWEEVSQEVYVQAYERFGGSVLSHPMVIQGVSTVVGLPTKYFAYEEGSELKAVIPVWKKWVAASKIGLKKLSRKRVVDFGNAELVLPINPAARIRLPVQAGNISEQHKSTIINLKASRHAICLSKSHGQFSKKFRYNRKRERRLLEEQGAVIKSIEGLSNSDIAGLYTRLFEMRWGFKPTGYERLSELLDSVRSLLFGSVIEMEGQAIAFQLIYKAECSSHISMEYINGGVDPAYKALSPGSVLTYVNTQQAWALSDELGKPLRYSFGKADNEYKDRWCSRSVVYSV